MYLCPIHFLKEYLRARLLYMPLMLGIINIIIAMILVSAKFRILKSNALAKKEKEKKVCEVFRQLVIILDLHLSTAHVHLTHTYKCESAPSLRSTASPSDRTQSSYESHLHVTSPQL